jgi:hypothetical protein
MSEAKRIDRGDVEEMVSVGGEGDAQIDAIWGGERKRKREGRSKVHTRWYLATVKVGEARLPGARNDRLRGVRAG